MSIEKSLRRTLSRSFLKALVVGLFLVTSSAWAQVVPVHGNNYSHLAEKWWQWAASVPTAVNPLLDETGANAGQEQNGGVWFLGGSLNQGVVERTITIPKNKEVFFPIINVINDNIGRPEPLSVAELQAEAAELIGFVDILQATLDGEPLSDNLFAFRAATDGFHAKVPLTGDIYEFLYDLDVGKKVDPIIADGYWLLLEPLSAGEHTLHFTGGITDVFVLDVTYHITVTN